LWLDYTRLYAIEKTVKNEDAAYIATVKGRYWLVHNLELSGNSPHTITKCLKYFTPDEWVKKASLIDKHAWRKEPNYLKIARAKFTTSTMSQKSHIKP